MVTRVRGALVISRVGRGVGWGRRWGRGAGGGVVI